MTNKELQAFRQGFCEKAAELGILPSELLSYSGYKQSFLNNITGDAANVASTATHKRRSYWRWVGFRWAQRAAH